LLSKYYYYIKNLIPNVAKRIQNFLEIWGIFAPPKVREYAIEIYLYIFPPKKKGF
jgi:hypothetical protein